MSDVVVIIDSDDLRSREMRRAFASAGCNVARLQIIGDEVEVDGGGAVPTTCLVVLRHARDLDGVWPVIHTVETVYYGGVGGEDPDIPHADAPRICRRVLSGSGSPSADEATDIVEWVRARRFSAEAPLPPILGGSTDEAVLQLLSALLPFGLAEGTASIRDTTIDTSSGEYLGFEAAVIDVVNSALCAAASQRVLDEDYTAYLKRTGFTSVTRQLDKRLTERAGDRAVHHLWQDARARSDSAIAPAVSGRPREGLTSRDGTAARIELAQSGPVVPDSLLAALRSLIRSRTVDEWNRQLAALRDTLLC